MQLHVFHFFHLEKKKSTNSIVKVLELTIKLRKSSSLGVQQAKAKDLGGPSHVSSLVELLTPPGSYLGDQISSLDSFGEFHSTFRLNLMFPTHLFT